MKNPLEKKPFEEFKRLHAFYMGGFDYQTKEIAAYLGVTPRTIQNWMKYKTEPSGKQLKKIKAYLDKKASQRDIE